MRLNYRQLKGMCLCLALGAPALSVTAADDDIGEVKRTLQQLDEQSRALAKRLQALEAEKAVKENLPQRAPEPRDVTQPEPARPDVQGEPKVSEAESLERIEKRVKELEAAKTAQETAVRTILRDTFAKQGSKINEYVTFGGAVEMIAGRQRDFSGVKANNLGLNTAEIDLEIRVNEWTLGTVVFGHVNGADTIFPTVAGFQTGVDRIGLDRAFLTIGDAQRFPLFITAGRMALPFGTSTGVHRTDVLSVGNPLTIEAFEMKKLAFGINFGYPTPALRRAAPGIIVPAVKPQLLNPLISSLGKELGYSPIPSRPRPILPTIFAPDAPPIYGSVHLYESNGFATVKRSFVENINTRIGYRTHGYCGRTFDRLPASGYCPWSLDVSIDHNTSIYESQFLQSEYRGFLDRFGNIKGMAGSVKSTLGAISVVGEWNGALTRATFTDDANKTINSKPSAWQLTLGYQLDWNPWVETIGAQGTFISVGYSQSRDLAGATRVFETATTRAGFTPKRRLLFTLGEWVADGLKVVVEFSRNWDYAINENGTGRVVPGLFTTMTYQW